MFVRDSSRRVLSTGPVNCVCGKLLHVSHVPLHTAVPQQSRLHGGSYYSSRCPSLFFSLRLSLLVSFAFPIAVPLFRLFYTITAVYFIHTHTHTFSVQTEAGTD